MVAVACFVRSFDVGGEGEGEGRGERGGRPEAEDVGFYVCISEDRTPSVPKSVSLAQQLTYN